MPERGTGWNEPDSLAQQALDLAAENQRLRDAAVELLALKDGPRDEDYEHRKPLAWQALRDALDHDHVYVSTACQHDLHDQCRLQCKFCDAPCMCGCHRPEWASPDEWIKCDYCMETMGLPAGVWHSSEAGHPTEKNEKGQWLTPLTEGDRGGLA